ncbi:hypothetical protein LLG95_14185 [bacterium]|nr:hypothetical protein [bacterium]
MDGHKLGRWRSWLAIAGATVVGFVAFVIVVVQILLVSNQIPQEKLAPRADLLRLTQPQKPPAPTKIDKENIDAALRPVSGRGQAFRPNWTARYHSHLADDRWKWTTWSLGQRFTAEQKMWIDDHRASFDDLFKAADDENFGGISCEAAAAMQERDLAKLWTGNGYSYLNTTYFRIEFARRREAGDLLGAAEVLGLLGKFAQSRREPFVNSYLQSLAYRYNRDRIMLGWMREAPVPPAVARRLRDVIASEDVSMPDLRRQLEIEYRWRRYDKLKQLNRPLGTVFRDQYNASNRYREMNAWNVLDDFQAQPGKTFDHFAKSAIMSVVYKSNAKSTLEEFDAAWTRGFDRLAKAPPGDLPEEAEALIGYGYRDEIKEYRLLDQAIENVILTALDRLIEPDRNNKPPRTDPFRNAPLNVVSETSSTLIYSLGPDRTDQHGQLTYDPTNGTTSAGDIPIRVWR